MNEKDQVKKIGELVLSLRKRNDLLEGVFMEYRIDTPYGRREIPWNQEADRLGKQEPYRELIAERLQRLHAALEEATDANSLNALYRHLFRG